MRNTKNSAPTIQRNTKNFAKVKGNILKLLFISRIRANNNSAMI